MKNDVTSQMNGFLPPDLCMRVTNLHIRVVCFPEFPVTLTNVNRKLLAFTAATSVLIKLH